MAAAISVVTLPLLFSMVTKYRLEKEKMLELEEFIQEIDDDFQATEIRSRLRYWSFKYYHNSHMGAHPTQSQHIRQLFPGLQFLPELSAHPSNTYQLVFGCQG